MPYIGGLPPKIGLEYEPKSTATSNGEMSLGEVAKVSLASDQDPTANIWGIIGGRISGKFNLKQYQSQFNSILNNADRTTRIKDQPKDIKPGGAQFKFQGTLGTGVYSQLMEANKFNLRMGPDVSRFRTNPVIYGRGPTNIGNVEALGAKPVTDVEWKGRWSEFEEADKRAAIRKKFQYKTKKHGEDLARKKIRRDILSENPAPKKPVAWDKPGPGMDHLRKQMMRKGMDGWMKAFSPEQSKFKEWLGKNSMPPSMNQAMTWNKQSLPPSIDQNKFKEMMDPSTEVKKLNRQIGQGERWQKEWTKQIGERKELEKALRAGKDLTPAQEAFRKKYDLQPDFTNRRQVAAWDEMKFDRPTARGYNPSQWNRKMKDAWAYKGGQFPVGHPMAWAMGEALAMQSEEDNPGMYEYAFGKPGEVSGRWGWIDQALGLAEPQGAGTDAYMMDYPPRQWADRVDPMSEVAEQMAIRQQMIDSGMSPEEVDMLQPAMDSAFIKYRDHMLEEREQKEKEKE